MAGPFFKEIPLLAKMYIFIYDLRDSVSLEPGMDKKAKLFQNSNQIQQKGGSDFFEFERIGPNCPTDFSGIQAQFTPGWAS